MLILTRKPYSALSSIIRRCDAERNQASLAVVASARLQKTFSEGSILVNLLNEQKHLRIQQYCSTTGKCDKTNRRMPIVQGLSVTFGAVIRLNFSFTLNEKSLGKWYSMCYITTLNSTIKGFSKGSSHPQPAKEKHINLFTNASAKIATTERFQIKQASSMMAEDEKLLHGSEIVIVKPENFLIEFRDVPDGCPLLEGCAGDYFSQGSVPSDGICNTFFKSYSSCQHEFAPIGKNEDVEKDIRDCAVCLDSEPKSEVTIIAFDIETTGLSLAQDRIIEFAARDLAGGNCSTLQSLVNPGRTVPHSASLVHGINDKMVNRSDVPSWREVAVAILRFVEIRRKGGPVILVAHNGKRFDVPFILKEFRECSMEFPSCWHFVDSLLLAREAMKANGLKAPSLKLSYLHDVYYGLPPQGPAHRAMADVHMLALVFGMLMRDLQLSIPELFERTFKVEHVTGKMIKAFVPSPGTFLKAKPQKELQAVPSAVKEARLSNFNDEDGIDLTRANVTRFDAGRGHVSVPWGDSHREDLAVHNIGNGFLQLVPDVSRKDGVQLNTFIIDEEKPLALSYSIDTGGKLYCLVVTHTVQRDDGVFLFHNLSRDLLKLQPCEMAFTLGLERVDPYPGSIGMRQLQGLSIIKWTDTSDQAFSFNFKTSDVMDSPKQKAALGDRMDIVWGKETWFPCSINKIFASDIWASHTSSVNTSMLSILLKLYVKTKIKWPRFLLLFGVGDTYEVKKF